MKKRMIELTEDEARRMDEASPQYIKGNMTAQVRKLIADAEEAKRADTRDGCQLEQQKQPA